MRWSLHSSTAASAVLLVAAVAASAQSGKWAVPRTPDGHPDLQGYWTNATFTPLERPVELGDKDFYTEAEALAFEKERWARENAQAKDDIHYDNVLWQTEKYSKGVSNLRTSVVYVPRNGRLPPLSAKGQQRAAELKQKARRRELAESAQDRSLAERCISWGAEGPPMLGSTYNANLQIVQTANHVVIYNEMVHHARIIPIAGRPHLTDAVRQLGGDSIGRWEGDTLVVDSTNFTDETNFRGPPAQARQDIFSSRDLHVVERFTRTGPDTILYQFTVDDPSSWTQPWSGELLMRRFEGPIYEYACHEGNWGLANILSAARAAERKK